MSALPYLVSLWMLAVGLSTTPRALREGLQRLPAIARALLVLLVGVPTIALAVVTALRLPPALALVIPLAAVCAGAPWSVGRDRPLVAVVLAVVALLVPLTGPVWLRLAHVDVRVASLGGRPLIPLAAGVALAVMWPRLAAPLARLAWYAFDLAAAAAGAIVLASAGAGILSVLTPRAIAAEVLLVGWSAVMGHWAGRPRPRDRHALATIAVVGNPALAAALLPVPAIGAVIALHVIVRLLVMAPYLLVRRRSVT